MHGLKRQNKASQSKPMSRCKIKWVFAKTIVYKALSFSFVYSINMWTT